jgi:hypothetical protein
VHRTHVAVTQIDRTREAFAGDRSKREEEPDALLISLDAREAAELGTTRITAKEMARRVLIYWSRRVGNGATPESD